MGVCVSVYLCARTCMYSMCSHIVGVHTRIPPTIVQATGVGPYVERRLAHLTYMCTIYSAQQ